MEKKEFIYKQSNRKFNSLTISSKHGLFEIAPIDPIKANRETTIPINISRNEKDHSC